nr:fused MFS/spermidine synthase [uncultured Roseateles sp.]
MPPAALPAVDWRRHIALALMVASGFAGLGYQIVWTQQSAVWLGHESAAVLAVVAAFFGGLALGALALGPGIERSARPVRWYAVCELVIALWSLVLALLMPVFGAGMLDLVGLQPSAAWQWGLAFCGTFLLLLPATAAMGATLPAMERVLAGTQQRSIAALYAGNTLGAVLGVLSTAFWLVPTLGLAHTAALCGGLNALCAAAALATFPRETVPGQVAVVSAAARGVLLRLTATGLLGIGYEVLVVRVLSQVAEDTVYTFALLLAVYLVGSALGAAAYQRWLARGQDTARLGDLLLCALALSCLLGIASLWGAEHIRAQVESSSGGMAGALLAEAALALAAFGLPTLAMGAMFSQLSSRASAAGLSFGQALGANTLGAAAAPLLFGVLLAPALGAKASLLLIVVAYVALARPALWRRPIAWAPAATALALTLWAPTLAFIDVPEGGRVLSYQEDAMAAVSVVQDAGGVARLRINNRQQEGSSSSLLADARQALLPLLLHPAPHRALFLGLGTGMTASSAAEDPTLEVDAVELLPGVITASRHFTQAFGNGEPNPRLHLIAADARRYVRAATQRYDLIVSDNFHPARSGSAALYTVEHFQAVRARLAPAGLFCQWLPLHQLDLETLRSIVQSFLVAYPQGAAILASNSLETPVLGLIGQEDKRPFDLAQVHARLAASALPDGPAGFGIDDEYALLGSFVAGPTALLRFAGNAPANTDDRPVVAYRAPRITYAPDSAPRDRLMALLNVLSVEAAEVLVPSMDSAPTERLSAYWTARQRFLEAGQHVRPSADVHDMLSQVRAPLLGVLRTSPDFRPAYDPLLRMAATLARTDRPAARALLAELAQAQPARPEAAAMLRQIADGSL